MSVKVVDHKKDVVFATDFTVTKSDVLNFYKTITAQESAKAKEAS